MFSLLATGNIYSVAEVGEQLAWLSVALRSSSRDASPAYLIPQILQESVIAEEDLYSQSGLPATRGVFQIGFSQLSTQFNPNSQGSCWAGLFKNPVIVTGYPIPRQEDSERGFQIPLGISAALINAERLVRFAGTVYIKGFSAMLVMTKIVRDTVFWHLLYNADSSYISYEDTRVHRRLIEHDSQTLASLENKGHVVGWCERICSNAGASDANYAIGWSGLSEPSSSCAFEKVTISGGQFIQAGLQCVLGRKDKPLHISMGDDYLGMLLNIAARHFVLYDRDERQAWLIDGASTLLHLLRTSIHYYQRDPRLRRHLSSGKIDLEETKGQKGSAAAFEILSNQANLSMPIYSNAIEAWEETCIKLGTRERSLEMKERMTYFTVKDRVKQLCYILCEVTAHHDNVHTEAGVGFRLRSTPRRQLEGFDFMDVATSQGTLWPKMTTLRPRGQGWVDFTRVLHAPTLFGCGFGDLLEPSPAIKQISSCVHCIWNMPLPKGKDYLAVPVAELKEILQKKGSIRQVPWRLVDKIHWYTPDLVFEPCNCQKSSIRDRVQVLLPSSFPKLWGRRSPCKLAAEGAVIFGHSLKFPLRWPRLSDEDPKCGEPESVGDMDDLFRDSGLGTSLDSLYSSEERSIGEPSTSTSAEKTTSKKRACSTELYRLANEQFILPENDHRSKRLRDSDAGESKGKKKDLRTSMTDV